LRPKSRLTLSATLTIFSICSAASFSSYTILARNARESHYVGRS
jgi:hypothetical protein